MRLVVTASGGPRRSPAGPKIVDTVIWTPLSVEQKGFPFELVSTLSRSNAHDLRDWSIMGHAHHSWLKASGQDIQRDYDELFAKAAQSGRTQEVGHGNEAVWQRFLENWLPPQYEVGTRKYIIGPNDPDAQAFETDIVVFNPGYPKMLRQRHEVMSGGVAAAFSTKLTLRAEGLGEAAEHSALLQKVVSHERGHARTELWKPYVFGMLAASHCWKSPGSKPTANVDEHLYANDLKHVMHPAQSMDLICVADLGTWTKTLYYSEHHGRPGEDGTDATWWNPEVNLWGESLTTSHTHITSSDEVTPLALFLSALYSMMSWRNPDMRDIASDFRRSNNRPEAAGLSRIWPAHTVLSQEALTHMRGAPYEDHNGLDSKLQGTVWS